MASRLMIAADDSLSPPHGVIRRTALPGDNPFETPPPRRFFYTEEELDRMCWAPRPRRRVQRTRLARNNAPVPFAAFNLVPADASVAGSHVVVPEPSPEPSPRNSPPPKARERPRRSARIIERKNSNVAAAVQSVAGMVVDSPVVAEAAAAAVAVAKASPKTGGGQKRARDDSHGGNKHNPRGSIAQQPTRLPSPSGKKLKRTTGSPQQAA
ncbi:unnamed protein product [Vitrella brassicaformis CCMP3155]|uniref:Uncharacterized protein n=1 Tax=Vitrella brassicaformis (strain CCMP3155) TaxID=1169540 RepID=A0A0G4F5E5_VITBC|nr:unnamed protein product [Vitrella brassicaformis CCMP3155]|eukprot:CEM06958.1 unnamed protein product [Vitrella brassicaformis CCMP3155]